MATFGSILDKPSKSIERPKPLPTGTYVCICKGLPKEGKAKTGTEFYEFKLEIIQPLDDVSEEGITAAGGVVGKSIPRATFYITDDSVWRLQKFLAEDLELEEGEKSLRQLVSETMGKQVLATIRHKPSDDGKSVFAEMAGTAPVSGLEEVED